jgi:hypothetical protein
MAISVSTNSVADPSQRRQIHEAMLDGIGPRTESETWRLRIFEPQGGLEYAIKIEGPNGFKRDRTFFGLEGQPPGFIRAEVAKATH